MVTVPCTFGGTAQLLVPKQLHRFVIPPTVYEVPIFQQIVNTFFYFSHQSGYKVLTHGSSHTTFLISLMANDVENLFMCLLVICVFSLEKYLFKYFDHFLNWGVFYWWARSSSHILDTTPLSDTIYKYLLPFCGLSFYFNYVLWCTKHFNFDKVQFINLFVLLLIFFGIVFKKSLTNPRSQIYCFLLRIL